jgi:DNA primase
VLAFDADGAGQSAAGRFYEWERRLAIDVAVASLPAGSDPGEMARSDPEGLKAAIEGAKPFLQFRLERILDAAELTTPEGRARAADTALAAVAEHPDNLVRDQYLMQVAERCRLEPVLLRERLEQLRSEGPRPQPDISGRRGQGGPASAHHDLRTDSRRAPGGPDDPWVREPDDDSGWDAGGVDAGPSWAIDVDPRRPAPGGRGRGRPANEFRPGLEALRLAIHRPEEVADRLEAALFRDELQRAAFLVLAEADEEPLHEVIDRAPPDVRDLLVRLTVEEPMSRPDEVVLQLVRDAARGELIVITAEARTSPEAGQEAADVASWVQELDDPTASVAATARLVAWLMVRAQTRTPEFRT